MAMLYLAQQTKLFWRLDTPPEWRFLVVIREQLGSKSGSATNDGLSCRTQSHLIL